MAERLKDLYGPEIPARVASMIELVHPAFDAAGFVADCLDGYEALELTDRARHISRALSNHLPRGFEEAAGIILASLGPPIEEDELLGQGLGPFIYLPYVFYVAENGVDDWETAMAVQHELTQRMSCEYSIRVFIETEPDRTMTRLRVWAADPNPHVRRLVSEGTRPRLPWAPRLRRFVDDPAPVVELLEPLKDDPSPMVRRSVANNLNDIGKDHPDVLTEVCRKWLADASPERAALIKHALRSAVKRGDTEALEMLGYGSPEGAIIEGPVIAPSRVEIGGRLQVSFDVINGLDTPAAYNVDLMVHFVKASGGSSPKVFKVRALELAAGERARLSKTISVAQHTTRTHHPGEHRLEVVVNGSPTQIGSFWITG
jgi:3-methyladenine DNA glycosylase AlkC